MIHHDPEDERLRARFQRELAPLEPAAPSFESLWQAARAARRASRARRPWVRRLALAGTAGALVALGVLVRLAPPDLPPPGTESLPRLGAFPWRGPTDFLLEVPDFGLLSTLPRFGGATEWPVVSATTPTNPS